MIAATAKHAYAPLLTAAPSSKPEAVALGGPILAASVVLEVAAALVARASAPAQIHLLLAPLRALALLAIFGLVFERIASALGAAVVSVDFG